MIVLLWNEAFVIDLAKPQKPTLVRKYELTEHKPWAGYGRIIRNGDKFLLLSTRVTAELTAAAKISDWRLSEISRTTELHNKTMVESRFPASNFGMVGYERRDGATPFLIKETVDCRYELRWDKEERGQFKWAHKKYLVKINKKDKKTASKLLLGEVIETGGE